MSRVRLIPIVFIVLITLAVLFGGFQAYRHLNFINPLQSQIEKNSAVQSVQIVSGTPGVVRVVLKPVSQLNNQDLQTTYHNLTNAVRSAVGGSIALNIEDHRNAALYDDYESMQPTILEGLRDGTYKEMIASVDKLAAGDHIQARITMDQQDLFVQLWTNSHYLYDVIPYQANQGGGAS